MELIYSPHRIYAQGPDGACIAEITFPVVRPGVWNIDHTFVDASLRGQAINVIRALVPYIRHIHAQDPDKVV